MANTIKTKIRLPISSNILEAIRKQFQDIFVEESGVYAVTRGFHLHNLLIALSKEYGEEFIAEHASSIDYYSTLYIQRYKDGICETIETRTECVIFYGVRASNFITGEVIKKIRERLKDYVEYYDVEFMFIPEDNKYCFKVKKMGDLVEVKVIGEIDNYIAGMLNGNREVDKRLIPELLAGVIGQKPKQPTIDSKTLHDYNRAFEVLLIAAEDVVNPEDKIDMKWCIRTLYQLDNQDKLGF